MIKERLKELRQEAGLTQVQMAEILGIEGRTYQRLEITEVLPPARHLVALADYYNVSVDYILGRTDKREINRCALRPPGLRAGTSPAPTSCAFQGTENML